MAGVPGSDIDLSTLLQNYQGGDPTQFFKGLGEDQIQALLHNFGVTPTASQLYTYTHDPQSLGSAMVGGTTGYSMQSGETAGGGIPLSTLLQMRGGGGSTGSTPSQGSTIRAAPSYFGNAPASGAATASGTGTIPLGGTITMPDGTQLQPEQVALQQMAQTDPRTEAVRQALSSTYLTGLNLGGAPTAQQLGDLIKLYGQVDPTSLGARQQLGTDLASQEALGTQLDPATQRQVSQASREAQIARGNVYGTPQMVEEAMTRGQAGLALQQQRQQALQSYLSSGQTTGDVALNLWNQQQQQQRANQAGALSYLTSGATPYQAGAGYLNTAENQANAAAAGGPQYAPSGPSPYYTGAGTSSFPQYGIDTSQTSANWYNLMNAYNPSAPSGGGGGGSAMQGGLSGALGGASMGATLGSAIPGIGTLVGAGVGALAGGALGAGSSYFG